jgi:hypothetical protein
VIDNPISSVERSLPYPGSAAVKPLEHSEKDKERAFANLLDESLEKEKDQDKKHDKDEALLGDDGRAPGQSPDEWIPTDPKHEAVPARPTPERPPDDGHLDLKA